MSRMTAEMVIDLKDKTGAATQAVIGNLSRLKRAERDYAMAQAGVRFSAKDMAHERLIIARQQELEEKRKKYQKWGMGGLAGAIGGAMTAAAGMQAYKDFAEVESKLNDIAITGERSFDFVPKMMSKVQQVANQTALSIDEVGTALGTMTTRGMPIDQAMSMLPQVSKAAKAMSADVSDVANAAYSLNNSLGIETAQLTKAFDEMAVAGKMGSFEARDMAQYFPELLPKFANLGYKGTEGLAKIVSMLQVVRKQTGESSVAANNMANLLDKLYTPETAKKFRKFGIDSQKTLDKTMKSGGDVIQTLMKMVAIATKGDLTKLSQLFEDKQARDAIQALLMAPGAIEEFAKAVREAGGVIDANFNQKLEESKSKIQQLTNNWEALKQKMAEKFAPGINAALDNTVKTMDIQDARDRARAARGDGPIHMYSREDFDWNLPYEGGYDDPEFKRRYKEHFQGRRGHGRPTDRLSDRGYTPDDLPEGRDAPIPTLRPRMQRSGMTTTDVAPQQRASNPLAIVDEYRARFDENAQYQDAPLSSYPPPPPRFPGVDDAGEKLRSAGADAASSIAGGGKAAADQIAAQAAAIGEAIGAAAARKMMSSINLPVAPQSLGSRPPVMGGDMSGVHASTNDSGL